MSLSHSPKIVTNGLVLCLDAADKKSYPGTGTLWTDRSGNGNNGTLVGGVGYNSNNGGIMVFDGVDDNVSFSTSNLIVNTVSLWLYIKVAQNSSIICSGPDVYSSVAWEWSIFIYESNIYFRGNAGNFGNIIYPAANYVNKWVNFTLIRNLNSLSYLYENGIYKNQASEASSANTNQLRIGKAGGAANVNIGNTLLYNRALTPQEILQNFNATRGRYGI
jgi:hypothetical protein